MKKRTPTERLNGIREALDAAGEAERIDRERGADPRAAAFGAWSQFLGALSWLEPDLAERIRPGIVQRIADVRKKYQEQIEAERASEYAINNGAAEMWGDE